MVKAKTFAAELREKTYDEVNAALEEKKMLLLQMRQQLKQDTLKDTNKYRQTKKDVARCLQVMTEKKRAEMAEQYKGKKTVPKNLRPKMTRAQRVAIPKELLAKKAPRLARRLQRFPRKIVVFTP